MAIIKTTKAQKLAVIRDMIQDDFRFVFEGNEKKESYVFDAEEARDFLTAEIEALTKKSKGEKKPSKNQEENERLKSLIVNWLTEESMNPEFSGATCSMILSSIPAFKEGDFQVQKVTALCTALKSEGVIKSEVIKGRSYFSLA